LSHPAHRPDEPVTGDTPIYRLVPVEQCEVVEGAWIFRSGAFDNSSMPGFENEMSVILGDTLAALGRDPGELPRRAYPEQPGRWGLAVLRASCVTSVPEQTIRRSPTPEECAHGDVVGAKNTKRRKRLKRCATWVFPPATAPP